MSSGIAKTNSIANAPAYSLRQAKFDRPTSISTAARSEVARKNSKVRQKTLKVKIRCVQTESKLSGEFASRTLSLGGKVTCSTSRATPWIAPKKTYVQPAPCHSTARIVVIRSFRQVLHLPPRLPATG